MFRNLNMLSPSKSPMKSPVFTASPSVYLSPYSTSIRSRPSFSQHQTNIVPSPSASPNKATNPTYAVPRTQRQSVVRHNLFQQQSTPNRRSPPSALNSNMNLFVQNDTFTVPNRSNNASPAPADATYTICMLDDSSPVNRILKEINMSKYIELFAEEEIDLFVFLMLTPEDLLEIGVEKADHSVIMNSIHSYNLYDNNKQM